MQQRIVRTGGIFLLAALAFAAVPAALDAQEGGGGEQEGPECQLEGKEITRQARDLLVEAARLDTVSPGQAQGNYREALTRLRLALKQDSADATAHLLAGRAYIGLDRYADADSMLTRFTNLKPSAGCATIARNERRSAWADAYNTGIRAYRSGQDEKALEGFERANVIWEDPRSLNNAALLYQQSQNQDKAEELYRRSMEIAEDPEQVRAAAVNLAELLRSRGKTQEALELYEEHLKEYPDDVTATINYAVGLRTAGQADSARAMFEKLLNREGLGFRQWFNVGLGLMDSQSYQGALRAFQQARENRPHDKRTLENLVQANMGAGNFGRAATLADSMVDWYPYQKGIYRSLMQALDRQGRTDAVQRILPQIQNLALEFPRLNMIKQGGAYILRGQVKGGARAGQEVTIPFEFLGAGGEVVATKDATITLPAQGQTQAFQLKVQSDQTLTGFRYGEVGGGS